MRDGTRRFAYRLASHLGWSNVDAMLRSMTSKQWLEWNVMYSLEPWGEDREDLRFGSVVQVLANTNRNAKKHPRPYSLIECSLSGGDQTVAIKQSWQQMKTTAVLLSSIDWKES